MTGQWFEKLSGFAALVIYFVCPDSPYPQYLLFAASVKFVEFAILFVELLLVGVIVVAAACGAHIVAWFVRFFCGIDLLADPERQRRTVFRWMSEQRFRRLWSRVAPVQVMLRSSSGVPTNETVTCAICTEDIQPDQEFRELQCGYQHKFHVQCIDPWIVKIRDNSCPLCRQSAIPTNAVARAAAAVSSDTSELIVN